MADIQIPSTSEPTLAEDNHLDISQTPNPTDAEHEETGGEQALQGTLGELAVEELDSRASVPQAQSPVSPAHSTGDSKVPTPIKKTMSANSKNASGGAPTTVKKIISSGTFGAGSVKPTGAKAAATTAPSKVTAPVLKKTVTPSAAPKPPMSSSTSAKPPVASAAPARRASVVPTKPGPPPVKTSLSASANTKPSPEVVRSSVASPTGSVASSKAAPIARPRASVSEAVKKAPLSARPSAAGPTKSTVPAKATTLSRSSAAPPTKVSRTTGSISSIQEVKEDSKAIAELQSRLEQANKALEAKESTVSALERQHETIEASLAAALAEVESKTATVLESVKAKAAAEARLQETQQELTNVQEEIHAVNASLESTRKELEDAKAGAAAQTDAAEKLQARIQELEEVTSSLKSQIELLHKDGAASASAIRATSIEREALLKAKSDFEAISVEIETLQAVHSKTLQDSQNQIDELRQKVAATEALQAQLASLKAEREENANKLSELEIEILELKETQDGLEDTREGLKRQVASLEDELANVAVAAGLVAESTSKKETEAAQQVEQLLAKHQQELEIEAKRYADIVASLEAVKNQHAEAVASHEQSLAEFFYKEGKMNAKLAEVEELHAAKQAALVEEMDKVSTELKSQEAIYKAKVDAVKAEHTQLLQEAFERAKNEAADAHSQELQAFRAASNTTIEEIRLSNKTALDSLQADHASLLENELNGLQKQISKLNLELKATQDDLAKAKGALESSNAEIKSLTEQRDTARNQLEATPDLLPQHADHISQLTKELANTKDDLAAVTDMLNLTKSSMVELSDKHKKELEGAAQGRADEVLKLRAAHDAETTTFANQKSELLVRLSDLEGDLATVKAALSVQQTASPKSNGSPQTTLGVSKEELARLHEAHNLRIYDIEAEHEKALKRVKEELTNALAKVDELEQDVTRKVMEIQYMEQDQEESQEQITRLKEDLQTLTEKIDSSDKS